jgi:hypothetical protein
VYYLLDLQKRSIVELDAPPDACGWWNNTQLLMQNNNADFLLYDVRQRETSPLGVGQVTASLLEHGLTVDDMAQVRAFPIWNGREYDFYVTHAHQNWLAKESFLFELERPDGRLKLISPRFKFEWSDHFDATGRQYLYSGRDFGTNSDGVFLRDVESGLTRALVDAGTNRDYSRPHFYRDSVIHVRSNSLWRISLDGSNDVKLFPPGEPQQSDRK